MRLLARRFRWKRVRYLSLSRRTVQVVFSVLLTILILKTAYPLRTLLPPESLFLIDPLVAVATWLAKRSLLLKLLPALGVVILALLLGRVWCGWLCPMGFAIDVSDKCFFSKKGQSKERGNPGFRKAKFFVLIFILGSSFFTLGMVGLFDPLSIFFRGYVMTLIPAAKHLINALLGFLRTIGGIAETAEWEVVALKHRFYTLGLLTFLVFVAILGLGALGHRFWCKNLCPLGAFLGLFSRFSLLSRSTKGNCIKCYACRDGCSMASITEPDSYHKSECIACLRCLENCPQKNISFAMGLFPKRTRVSYDPTRRQVLAALGISIFSVGVFKSNLIKNKKNSNVIRPPGSLAEEEFLAVCIKCGECIKVCLTNVLQPTLLEAGVEGIWTPRLIPRRGDRREVGGCPKYCNLCTRVCPTDAIRFLTLEEKPKFRIGLANLYKDKCLAWAWNTPCFVCYDYCPYYAIRLDEIDGLKRPSVIHEKCIGCGVCEHRCPIEGSAIKVTAQRETREERGKRVRSIIRKDTIIDSSL